ncbi:phospholipase C, phosphocholine-specific [Streptomyces sp. H10-C2]|uniref:phosphocholine-specific phospholipase C n=1 Tax=unclassified Streptomyces TaxID=2593676 RepID=UPI0024BAEDF2|nr:MULTISPECIES: phospholipase C, phosphocholine-specific [unclassified Streptomyces]MDJ0340906.1 phospholipase C, phosphocholine-specific [Streptomyces sp. PH10-H1]MDJ0369862.1 phospholipase C, phosphocholine-specific [Streptomyces sp. H10-C2]
MTAIDRRRFMQLAGGTAAASLLSTSIARAAEIPANRRTGSLRDVEHIVVLMQENRSFDHYFGTLRGARGFGDPRPVVLPSGKPVWHQSDGTKDVLPFHPEADNLGLQFLQDLNHDWNGGHAAFNQGKYDKWVPAKSATTMAYLTREDIPFHYALADTFTICDAYHCSLIGPTDPNRYYLWTGFTGNDGKGGGPVITNAEAGYSWTTYPERLERAGVSWKIYQDVGDGLDAPGGWGWIQDAYRGNYGDNSLLYFNQYRNAKPGDPLYDKARTGTNAKAGEGFFDILKADVAADRLPQVSWIAAPEAFTEHPNWPVNYGAWYISQVLDALTSNPEVWSKTAVFITYDENDGFFDHIVPPHPPVSRANGQSTVDVTGELFAPAGSDKSVAGAYGLGQRVPMLVVSPWSKGGWVNSQVFDHTSIIRFMERRFGVHEPNISPWRRAVCGDLTTAFQFARTDTAVPALPPTDGYLPPDRDRHPDYVPVPPANPVLPKQEPGLRPARPLPYDLAADGRTSVTDHRLRIDFANHGKAGAHLYVTSATNTEGPWTYTVEAGRRLSDSWSTAAAGNSAYDFTVHGPNGFLRQFTGRADSRGPEVSASHDGDSGQVRLVLTNPGATTVKLTVKDGYGHERPATYRLRPGARAVHTAHPRRSHDWYDLSVVSGQDGSFLRRLAGHVETGRPGTSDPAIATG